MISAMSRSRLGSLAATSISATPTTPFRGVRISWLMLARNSLLERLAASAFCWAERRRRATRRCQISTAPAQSTKKARKAASQPWERAAWR